jgi:hypothetical protein
VICLVALPQNLSQGSVPDGLTLEGDLAFVFNASRVRRECCVDLLRPLRLPGI